VADLTDIPLTDDSIELVVSNSVLEHINDYNSVVSEVYRTLVVGRYFYPCMPNACLRHHKYDFHRWTTPGLYRLLEGKFEIIGGACRGIAYSLIPYVEAFLTHKIKNRYLLSTTRFLWRLFSSPLFLIKDEKNEEYQVLSQTIYVLGRKL